jgi:hypothetical protein
VGLPGERMHELANAPAVPVLEGCGNLGGASRPGLRDVVGLGFADCQEALPLHPEGEIGPDVVKQRRA